MRTQGGVIGQHAGGKVFPGRKYLVSEFNQPEVFIPQTRGEIVPGAVRGGGGGGGLTVIIHYNGVSLGNRLEAEEVLIPLVEKAFREFSIET